MADDPRHQGTPEPNPVGAALAASAEAARRSLYPGMCRDGACMSSPCQCAHDAAAAAVVAFLRALPERFPMPGRHNPECRVWGHAAGEMSRLADAVERSAIHA